MRENKKKYSEIQLPQLPPQMVNEFSQLCVKCLVRRNVNVSQRNERVVVGMQVKTKSTESVFSQASSAPNGIFVLPSGTSKLLRDDAAAFYLFLSYAAAFSFIQWGEAFRCLER